MLPFGSPALRLSAAGGEVGAGGPAGGAALVRGLRAQGAARRRHGAARGAGGPVRGAAAVPAAGDASKCADRGVVHVMQPV